MLFNIVIAVVVVLVVFVAWRYTSVARGAKARDEALLKRLDPLAARFESKSQVAADDVRALAAAPSLLDQHRSTKKVVHLRTHRDVESFVGSLGC